MSAVTRSSGCTLIGAVSQRWDGESALEMAVAGAEEAGRDCDDFLSGRASGSGRGSVYYES